MKILPGPDSEVRILGHHGSMDKFDDIMYIIYIAVFSKEAMAR